MYLCSYFVTWIPTYFMQICETSGLSLMRIDAVYFFIYETWILCYGIYRYCGLYQPQYSVPRAAKSYMAYWLFPTSAINCLESEFVRVGCFNNIVPSRTAEAYSNLVALRALLCFCFPFTHPYSMYLHSSPYFPFLCIPFLIVVATYFALRKQQLFISVQCGDVLFSGRC